MNSQAAEAEQLKVAFPGCSFRLTCHPGPSTPPSTLNWSVESTVAGPLLILSDRTGIVEASFADDPDTELNRLKRDRPGTTITPTDRIWLDSLERRTDPDTPVIPLSLHGTSFQLDVWNTLLTIPWGETRTYGWIAEAIGRPTAYRAVGSAVGANPVALLVPCHRVLPVSGKAGNYAGGIDRKVALLTWEGAGFRN